VFGRPKPQTSEQALDQSERDVDAVRADLHERVIKVPGNLKYVLMIDATRLSKKGAKGYRPPRGCSAPSPIPSAYPMAR
jgi:hypothetical protein